ncbi:hypothetical protein [Bacillus sp. FJAT-27445]|uniref:hypothetical protein n=1 Tax=Bacillus sp. FJAT-27445 TaxID=1679166 RepID=UPI000743CFD4|nr:hypothetical protein [Bacillus sp. FJAT-27445]
MMVTAILIPIICLYFLWLTLKEAKENEKRWLQTATANEEAVVNGTITSIFQEKQRFYYHRYIIVQELMIKADMGQIKAKIITPLTKVAAIKDYRVGQELRIYGSWEKNWFHANRVEAADQGSKMRKRLQDK